MKVGVASYSYSKLTLDDTIKGVQRVGVSYVSIKDAHLPMKSTAEQRKAVTQKFRDAGITPLSCGVVTMTNDEAADSQRIRVCARRRHPHHRLQADARITARPRQDGQGVRPQAGNP